MTESTGQLECPECSLEHDPHLRFCTQCGVKLPAPKESATVQTGAVGVARGIEPPQDALQSEPRYTRGRRRDRPEEPTAIEQALPIFRGVEPDSEAVPAAKTGKRDFIPPSPWLLGFLIVVAIALPPIGVLTSIIMAFNSKARHAALPTLLACVLGGGLWGWGIWADTKNHMYDAPFESLEAYVDAQSWAMSEAGHYLPLLELKMEGYLPPDFPEPDKLQFHLVEHVLGPTGFLIEVAPEAEEVRFYRMESLWVDQTGTVKLRSSGGPIFNR